MFPTHAVIGHRGNRAHSPENTIVSMREALALGAHGLEFDVRITSDGVPVLMHDATIDRTTDGHGQIAEMRLDDVRRLNAGARFTPDGGASFPFRDRDLGVPLLADVLDAFPGTPVIVEIKVPQASRAVQRVILDHAATGRCIVGAFRHETLVTFAGGSIARTASTREVARLCIPALLGRRYIALPFQCISVPQRHHGIPVPLAAIARAVAQTGVPVCVWTINEPATAERVWSAGVRAVLSDDPGALLALAGAVGRGSARDAGARPPDA